ncbi:MAG: hypothetical protein MJ033_07685 [Victivallaceae bacterium]|nr:hypothetical protein [Victivallaceae bacterium]
MKRFCKIATYIAMVTVILSGNSTFANYANVEIVDMTKEKSPSDDFQKIQEEVNYLDERHEYSLAYHLINKHIQENYSVNNIQFALEHVKKHLKVLSAQNTRQSKSDFVTPEDPTTWEIIKFQSVNIIIPVIAPGPVGLVYKAIVDYATWDKLRTADKINYKKAMEQVFPVVEGSTALEVMEQYNIIKESLKVYLAMLEKTYPMGATESEKQKYFSAYKKVNFLKEQAITQRCIYVSYNIISPALAEASKGLYIATFKWLGLDDKKKIENATIQMCHSFHKEWLKTSKEDVRFQCQAVIRDIKDRLGSAEWEELKEIATVADSNDPSKQWGASAWWNE